MYHPIRKNLVHRILKTAGIASLLICGSFSVVSAEGIDLSVKGGYFHYQEPDAGISYSGLVSGIQGAYRKDLTSVAFKLRSEFMSGNLSYDGHLNSHEIAGGSTPSSEIDQSPIRYDSGLWYSDSAFLAGKSIPFKGGELTPFAGIGFRFLNNSENPDVLFDYGREVTYLYLPIAVDYQKQISKKESWGISGEVDLLLHGSARAALSDVSDLYNDLEFKQTTGAGIKLSGSYIRQVMGLSLAVKPFCDLWMVGNSESDELQYDGNRVLVRSANGDYGDYREPANLTLTGGLQLALSF